MTNPSPGYGVARYAAPGMLVAGRYRLSRRIAGGGMGEVWRGHDRILDDAVAVKLLRTEYLEEPAFLARFRAEARLAGILDHPGIAAVRDYGEDDGPTAFAWLVMELVDGEPLSRMLARMGALPPEQALDLLGQAAVALQAAHDAGVVHRDVKPGNLLVRPDGILKVTDFGIARAVGSAPLTRTGTVLGTAHYLSPEQARGKAASPASDVYALGVVGYECLAGRRPFEGDSPVEVALAHQRHEIPPLPDQLPAPVIALVMRALAKDPARRPSSAGSLGRTALGIRAALYLDGSDDAGVPKPRPHTEREPRAASPPAGRRARLGMRVAFGAGGLAAAIVFGVLIAGSHGGGAAEPAPRPAAPASTTDIALNPATYRGQTVDAVFAALIARGLVPHRVDTSGPGLPGTVVTILGTDGAPLPAALRPGAAVDVQVVAGPTTPITP